MLSRFGQALRLGLAPDGLALVKTSRWRRGQVEVLAERPLAPGDDAALAQALAGLSSDFRIAGWPVTVVLSDELARMWQVTPPPAASRPADLEAAAALRFQSLFGASSAQWKIAADWDAVYPFLAAAVPQALLDRLRQAALEQRFHLVGIAPQFVLALNQWRKLRRPGAWFGQVQAGVLAIAAFEGEQLAAVRSAPLPPGADREWLESLVAREALRVGMDRPDRLQVCGPAPASWASTPGRLKFACSLLDPGERGLSTLARLAATGSAP
jgi:hypothetical protein